MNNVETINEYRQKHKRCRTCKHLSEETECSEYVLCKAKQKTMSTYFGLALAGIFCSLYTPKEFR